MIPKKQRIKAEDIVKMVKNGKNANSANFYVKYIENGLDFPRFSIIISKKTSILSVRRHLLKRRVSDIVENGYIHKENGIDCLIFSKENAEKLAFSQIKEEISKLLSFLS